MTRRLPNILITGTPGVGKTTLASELASLSLDTPHPLQHISVNEIIKKHSCHEGYDERLKTYIVDEDKMLDQVEKEINDGKDSNEGSDDEVSNNNNKKMGGGYILDYHVPDLFPDRWIDLVIVLRCNDTQVFYERLAAPTNKGGRGYEGEKLQENIDAEIFGVVCDEAFEGYPGEGRVVELQSCSIEDVEANCERVLEWVGEWVGKRKGEAGTDAD